MSDHSIQPPSIADRIGGRWAVSWQLALVACVSIVAMWLLASIGVQLPLFQQEGSGVASVTLQCAAIVAVLFLAHLTVLRHRRRRPVPVWLVVAVGAAAAGARVAVEAWTADQSRPLDRTIIFTAAALALGATFPPIVAYLLATREWYVDTRDRLIRLELDQEARRLRADGAVDALETIILDSAQTQLDDASAVARAALADADREPIRAADALLHAAREGVRPASRSLTDPTSPHVIPSVSVGRAIATELHRHPLPILLPTICLVIVAMPRAMMISGLFAAIVIPAIMAVCIAAVYRAGRPLIRRAPRLAIPVTLAAAIVAVAPPTVAQNLLLANPASPQTMATTAVVLFIMTFLVSVALTLEDSSTAVLEALRRPLEQAELERLATERAQEQLQREIGLHLHAGVQPQMVAASYAIQDAVARGDRTALEEAIGAARAALDQRIEPQGQRGPVDIVAAVEDQWGGILDVHWDPPRVPTEANSREVADVIRECLSNAVVHGNADSATITVVHDGDGIDLCIVDDGDGPRDGRAGLGSAVLNDATGGSWSLAPAAERGAVVRARVPLVAVSPYAG